MRGEDLDMKDYPNEFNLFRFGPLNVLIGLYVLLVSVSWGPAVKHVIKRLSDYRFHQIRNEMLSQEYLVSVIQASSKVKTTSPVFRLN